VGLSAGDTFILTRGTGSKPHLWVLLWGPAGAARAFLAVHLTTLRPHCDKTCVIRQGEHPFVQHDTCAVFGSAKPITEGNLVEAIRARQAFQREPVSEALLMRLREGLRKSPWTSNAVHEMLRDRFGATGEQS
jgi:hypothetical protein